MLKRFRQKESQWRGVTIFLRTGGHPLPPTHTHTQKPSKTLVFPLFDSCPWTNRQTDRQTDGQSLLQSCVSATWKENEKEWKKEKQVTQGHNIVADGWAGASNPQPHPTPIPNTPPTIEWCNRFNGMMQSTLIVFNSSVTTQAWRKDRRTDRQTDGRMDERTDGRGRTDWRTDKDSYSVACPQLKMMFLAEKMLKTNCSWTPLLWTHEVGKSIFIWFFN